MAVHGRARSAVAVALGLLASLLGGVAFAASFDTAAAMRGDPRWRDLPFTKTEYHPARYETLDAWKARAERIREQILWAAALYPPPAITPLNAEIFGRIEHEDYTVEKVYFESYPDFYVTGNLYRPRKGEGPFPAVACPHGHWAAGRLEDSEVGSVAARCITFARMGCAAFSYDMIGYNDSAKQIDHRWEDLPGTLWGFGPLALQLYNSKRVIDFLQSLPDVDPRRIGCTGASGGGTQTFLIAAIDSRVKVAAPVNMISAHFQGGCVCENAPGLRIGINNVEIGAAFAPRPLFLVSATGDWTKNTPTVEYPAIRAVYKLYGAEDKVGMIQIDAPHNYNKASREAVYQWFAKWLLDDGDYPSERVRAIAESESAYQKEKDEDLLVFHDRELPEGAVDRAGLLKQRIAAARVWLASMRPRDAATYAKWRKLLGKGFAMAVAMWEPPADVRFDVGAERSVNGIRIQDGVLIEKGRGTRAIATTFEPADGGNTARGWTVVVTGKGRSVLLDFDGRTPGEGVRRLVAAGQRVLALDVLGVGDSVGEAAPDQPRGSSQFFTTFNRTDAAERAWDIATAVSYCRGQGGAAAGTVNLIGEGAAGPWCLVAMAAMTEHASLDAAVGRAAIDADGFHTDDEATYLRDCYVPGILRIGGLAAAASLAAPKPLLLHNVGDAFDTSMAEAAYSATKSEALDVRTAEADVVAIVEWIEAR
jgi:dienelactone hydrolase